MKHLSVVEDPIRTTFNGPPEDPRTGAWTFARLMEDMAPTPAEAPAMVEQMLNTWLTDQVSRCRRARPFSRSCSTSGRGAPTGHST
ncbi:hypothetical protein BE20_14170 [Sorangium cellulosum]|nr:hypothetical protein BE20_14170 [Sorangium cellulosum]